LTELKKYGLLEKMWIPISILIIIGIVWTYSSTKKDMLEYKIDELEEKLNKLLEELKEKNIIS
jgi:K+ transporter